MIGRRVIALGLGFALCGCMAFQSKGVRTSQAYRAGYSDGCAAAGSSGATIRTEDAAMAAGYQNDRRYRAGYTTGFSSCRATSRDVIGPERGPVADPYPGLPR